MLRATIALTGFIVSVALGVTLMFHYKLELKGDIF